MKVIEIRPNKEPRVVDLAPRTIERQLNEMIHEEALPIDGTMSLSALRTDGLALNTLMVQLTGDDGYFGTVYICGVWYADLSQDQINAVLDWLEGEDPPDIHKDVDEYDPDEWN